jgi:hypothetical protein
MGTPEDAKTRAAAARIREDCLRFIRAADVRSVEVNVVYAVGLSEVS